MFHFRTPHWAVVLGSFSHANIEHRPLTLKVDEDDEVIVLEVITPPEVKVLDEVPPAP